MEKYQTDLWKKALDYISQMLNTAMKPIRPTRNLGDHTVYFKNRTLSISI